MLEDTINLNLSIHWIFLSVYRWTIKAVKLKINKLLTEYIYLKNYRKKSRAIVYYKKRFDFIADMDRLFNIDGDEIQTNSKSCFGVKSMKTIDFLKSKEGIIQIDSKSNFNSKKLQRRTNKNAFRKI